MKRSEVARYAFFPGIDVGKSSNYAVLLDRHCDGPLMPREVAQDEGGIRALIRDASVHGELPVTVDQYGAFGRPVVAVARDMGVGVAHVAPRRLKNAAIRSAQCALQLDKRAAAYYEKKRAEGKGHKQALRALARRRVDVIYALLCNGTFYEVRRSAR